MQEAVRMPHISLTYDHCDAVVIGDLVNALKAKYKDITIAIHSAEETEDDEELVNVFETDWWKSMTPGDLLAGCRLKHGLTQKQLAEKVGMSYATISAFETGRRPLSRRAAIKLSAAMDETPERFFRNQPRKKGQRE